jgi:hypothetical protein
LPVNGAASVTVTGRRPVPVSEIVQPEPFLGTVTAPPTLSARTTMQSNISNSRMDITFSKKMSSVRMEGAGGWA